MVVLLVEGQVLAQRFDPCAQQGDLDFRRAGILLMKVVFFDDLLFSGQILRHDPCPFFTEPDRSIQPYSCKAQSA